MSSEPNGAPLLSERQLSGWGRFPRRTCMTARPATEREIPPLADLGPIVARGNGRAYGDSAIGARLTVEMARFNCLLAFDEMSGLLVCEAGVLLKDIIETFLPQGWFPYVTPGTKFVTIGGMLAADVHGKNHHIDGSFGKWVEWIDLITPEGAVSRCSAQHDRDLFEATIGGMGLTGIILRAAFRLRRVETAFIRQTTIAAPNLDAAMALFDAHEDSTYSVAWIDCLSKGNSLGRSIVMLGEHASSKDLPKRSASKFLHWEKARSVSIPFPLPLSPLNKVSISLFNALYYRRMKNKSAESIVDWNSFFYPLDAIARWNNIYGRNGFVQHQSVIPLERARDGLRQMLQYLNRHSNGSFLAVLKKFGDQGGRWSFPMPGYTLALDFPVGRQTEQIMQRLNEIVAEHGGRLYLAKDACLDRATALKLDKRLGDLKDFRLDRGFSHRYASRQAERLGL